MKIMKTSISFSAGLLFAVYCLASVSVAEAAAPRVYLERVGNFGVRIMIDSPEPINAYDVSVTYEDNIAAIESVDASRSIVTVLPAPMKTVGGEIVIKGGSTKPFSGTRGELLTIQLKPVSPGTVQFNVTRANAYLADGKGTALALSKGSLPLRVTSGSVVAYAEAKNSGLLNSNDSQPPEITTIEIQANPLQYGERLLVFQAMDKETGVARYEARERSWLTWSNWREAFNPYRLESGAWQIQIKAVDYNNNEALATVYQLGNAIWKAGVSIVLLFLIIFALKSALRRKKLGSV